MPAIVFPSDYAKWLDNSTPTAELSAMLKPYPAEEMEAIPVGPTVNSPKNDSPDCLTPAA